jgi:hypothetical protein
MFVRFILICSLFAVNSCKKDASKSNITLSQMISKEEVLQTLNSWKDAYLLNRTAPLYDILDDSWIYSGSSDGSVATKAEAIEEFNTKDYHFADIIYSNLDVVCYDDIAIIRGTEELVIVNNTNLDTAIINLRFTDVYQKKNNKIKAISTHSSPIKIE